MSTTTVFLAHHDRVEEVARLKNSWGSAAFVWFALSERYLGDKHIWSFSVDGAQKLWDLVDDSRLSLTERIVLACTFDHAIIEHERFREAAGHWMDFKRIYHKDSGECHAGTIAQLLLDHQQTSCIGMCFQQTSVARDLWHLWDDDNDAPIPFNLEVYPHFFVFDKFGTTIQLRDK